MALIEGLPPGLADRHCYGSAYLDGSCVLRAGAQTLQAKGLSQPDGHWVELLGGSIQGGLAAAKEISRSGKRLRQKKEDLPPNLLVKEAVMDWAS